MTIKYAKQNIKNYVNVTHKKWLKSNRTVLNLKNYAFYSQELIQFTTIKYEVAVRNNEQA